MFLYMQKAEDAADEISNVYLKSSRYISTEADAIFEKFQTKHSLSEKEAIILINTLQDRTSLDELLQKLRNGDLGEDKKKLIIQLEAPAYQARLDRLRQLQKQLDIVMQNVYQQEKTYSSNFYTDLAKEAYYRNIFNIQQRVDAAFSFNHISAKRIDRVVNSKWSGKNYSERIWSNTKQLAKELKEELLINLITGRTNREAAESITNKFGQGASNARRLVRTESNYLAGELNAKAYEECGIEEYQFLATLDLRTSLKCRDLDGKIFLVKDRKVGVNCNPMHPWCRSTTISVVNRKYMKMQRSAIDPATGKRIKVPRNISYLEWYDKYVKRKPEVELEEKKIKNRNSDREQHKRYREVIGKETPKKLDDFQKMKYTDSEKWKFMKLDYKRRNELSQHPERKLPNAENATAAEAKFTKYLFGGNNPDGLPKGKNFDDRLGYNAGNWKMLQSVIQAKASMYPAASKGDIGFGEKFEQKIVLYGLKGKPANVVVGWIHKPDGATSMTSAYIKEV